MPSCSPRSSTTASTRGPSSSATPPGRASASGRLRRELGERGVAGHVEVAAVAHHRVVAAAPEAEHLAPRARVEARGGARLLVAEVDDVADDRGGARDPARRLVLPAD